VLSVSSQTRGESVLGTETAQDSERRKMYRGLFLLALAVGAEAFAFGPSAAFPAKTTASLRRASHVSGRAVAPLGLRMAGDKAEIDFGKVGFDQESQVGQTLTVPQCTHSRLRCAVTRHLGPVAGPAAQPSSPPPSAPAPPLARRPPGFVPALGSREKIACCM